MIRPIAMKSLALLSGITTMGSAPDPSWEEFWPGLVTRVIVDLDEAGDDAASKVVADLLAEMHELLVPPMTPQEEYLLAGTRLDRASSRAAALRHAAERDQLAAEAEFLAAQSSLARFESSPGIPLPQYREVARDGDGD